MAARFPGYPSKGMTWLRQIAKNNERDWFQAHKPTFEADVKAPTLALVEALNVQLERFAPQYVADPKKAVKRIYRDTRFSHDKSPYKTYMAAMFAHRGRAKEACAGFWLSISAKGADVVGGSYAPGTPQLTALRTALAADPKPFQALCKRKALRNAMGELQGETLKRPPRGFDPEHAAVELLKHKQFYFHAHLPAKLVTTPDLQKEIARRFKLMTPFVAYLDDVLAGT